MGLVNDFYVIGESKLDKVVEYIPLYEYENDCKLSHVECVWDRFEGEEMSKGLEGLDKLSRSVLYDIILNAGLYVIGVGRFKYIDYLQVEVDVSPDGILMNCNASVGDAEVDEEWECWDDEKVTLPYTPVS